VKRSVTIDADEMPAGILKLLDALELKDIEEMARFGTALSVFAGIGRALFTAREAADEYRQQQQRAAPAAPAPATVIDYRSTPAAEPEVAEVPEIPATEPEPKSAPEPSTNGNRLPTDGQSRRMRVARLIAEKGPQTAREIMDAIGIPKGSMASMGHPFFTKEEGKNKPYHLSELGRAAVGANTLHPAEGIPSREPESPPEPEPVPAPAAAPADPEDPKVIAREQVLAIARAISAANGKLTRKQIAAASGLDPAIVRNRLRNGGPNASLPAFTYFSRTEQPDGTSLWGLTHNGAALVREAEANPQRPSGA
jgi:hypothetical protein